MAHGCGQLDVFTAVRNYRKAPGHPIFLFFALWLVSFFLPFLFLHVDVLFSSSKQGHAVYLPSFAVKVPFVQG